MASLIHSSSFLRDVPLELWLVGNGLSDTLKRGVAGSNPAGSGWLGMASLIHSPDRQLQHSGRLWLVGNGLSDTLRTSLHYWAVSALAGWEWPL